MIHVVPIRLEDDFSVVILSSLQRAFPKQVFPCLVSPTFLNWLWAIMLMDFASSLVKAIPAMKVDIVICAVVLIQPGIADFDMLLIPFARRIQTTNQST